MLGGEDEARFTFLAVGRWLGWSAGQILLFDIGGRLPASARQELPGITPDRTFQIVAGAVVLHTAMRTLDIDELEVSPWALREGVLLRDIEAMAWG